MIEIKGLTKKFGALTAVNELSFRIERGDAFGFVGPNGAGKTTTIKMLATLLMPDGGSATVNGHDVVKEPEAVRACIGYMPDFFGVYDDMKAWEYLDFFAAAYRVPAQKRPQLIRDVLELTDLSHKRDDYVDALSRGMKQRLCLAKTLVHDPDVLLLDEPASGLDPRARIEIRELLQELVKMDKTILISSHILPELAELCNKIAIIEGGKLVLAGDVKQISSQLAGGLRLIIRTTDRLEEACAFLAGRPEIASAEVVEQNIECVYQGPEGEQHSVLTCLVQAGYQVQSFSEEATDLEDLYMRLTRGMGS
ncbi:MAG: ABC transporter ATP-binding protein [Armatimonadota bacterium]